MANEVKQLVDRIIEKGVYTREDHASLELLIWADGVVDEAEKAQLRRLSHAIQSGAVIVGW
ncbi:MAG: hypothetical protein GY851_08810 [bacterium]|nr:hypothetical protein [bacterium]